MVIDRSGKLAVVAEKNPTVGVLGDAQTSVSFVPPCVAAIRASVLAGLGGAEVHQQAPENVASMPAGFARSSAS